MQGTAGVPFIILTMPQFSEDAGKVHIAGSLKVDIVFSGVSSCSPVANQAVTFCSGIEPPVQDNLDFLFAALKSELHLLGGQLHVHWTFFTIGSSIAGQ